MNRRYPNLSRTPKHIRIPDDLARKFEKAWKERGLPSENEAWKKAGEHWLACSKAVESLALKLIPLKYPGQCQKCGRKMEAGEWGWWAPGVGVICTDCEVQKYGDKATVKKLVKVKELAWQKKVLDKEIDQLLQKYGEFSFYEVIDRLHAQNREVNRIIMDYFQKLAMPDEEAKFKDVLTAIQDLFKVIEEARRFMQQPWLKKKKKVPGVV